MTEMESGKVIRCWYEVLLISPLLLGVIFDFDK
jgi:hypothetical protein